MSDATDSASVEAVEGIRTARLPEDVLDDLSPSDGEPIVSAHLLVARSDGPGRATG
ncbi:hypothetical protein ACGF3G_10265 [Streptomyces sp. NPDC048179]|uniref:hypothetical protein n=1 Tax=Streptomyces sp. NPDC048179 TaxID=3365506 RepID=UPI00371130B0